MKTLKTVIATLCVLLLLTAAIWFGGRYGWKLFGFRFCTGSGIESVSVSENAATISGFYPGSFPEGYLGCIVQQEEDRLYLGVRYDPIFGLLELGQFTEEIPLEQEISAVYLKTAKDEYQIWSAAMELQQESEALPEEMVSVSVGPAVERLLVQRPDHKFFSNAQENPYAQKVLLTFSEPVYDFKLLTLEGSFDENGAYICTAAEPVYEDVVLMDSDLMVVETEFEEFIPRLGFCFTQSSGLTRYFYLTQSGEDGMPLAIEMTYSE